MLWNSFDHANLARALLSYGRHDGALTACSMGLRKTPDSAELQVLLARAYDGLGRPGDALAACECALALEKDGLSAVDALIQQALIVFGAGEVAQAFAIAERAWNLAPGNIHVLILIGNLFSWNGDLSSALGFIEWNWVNEQSALLKRFGGAPPWDGGDLHGKSVFVAHGQGFGDMLHMARYLPALRARASRVIVECLPQIAPVMQRMHGVDEVVEYQTIDADGYDVYARLMTLPRILGIDAGAGAPYLAADPKRIEHWKARFGSSAGYRVGLVWGGSRAHVFDYKRSMPPERLRPLGGVRGVTYYSLMLQEDAGLGFDVHCIGRSFRDFDDAAAAIAQLDLVITVDTAYAHLAGALGIPVWTLLPARPDWRWSGNGETTSWYPSMRLFREIGPGWPTVVERVASELSRQPLPRARGRYR